MSAFKELLDQKTKETGRLIMEYLPEEKGFQETLFKSCNYSVINGGKRLRPIMMEACYLLCSGKESMDDHDKAIVGPFMAAMEMMHSSSLVHDDLPCMDNDRLRRGKPSTWAVFGDDIGTLAGDGLMIYTFETALKSAADPELKCRALEILAHKAGIYGMVGGQTVDVELTGKRPSKDQLDFIYRLKTGALIEGSFMTGAVLAGASKEKTAMLEEAALAVGMAFQIRDDILDVISTDEELGKPVNSDEENGKVTWLTYYGMEQAEADVRKYTERAIELIRKCGSFPFLEDLCMYLINRKV